MVIVVEGAASFHALLGRLHSLGVGEINVGPAVAIVVDQSNPAAHGLNDELRLRTRTVFETNSGGCTDVSRSTMPRAKNRTRIVVNFRFPRVGVLILILVTVADLVWLYL